MVARRALSLYREHVQADGTIGMMAHFGVGACFCFVVLSTRAEDGLAGECSAIAKLIVLRNWVTSSHSSIIIWPFLGTPDRLVMVA